MPSDTRTAIRDSAEGPRRVRGDEGEVEQHSLKEQIEADRYLDGQTATARTSLGLRFRKFKPPGTA